MDEAELESMLKPFGQVISTRILRDASGTSRGVGFARSGRMAGKGLGIVWFHGTPLQLYTVVLAGKDKLA